MKNLGAAAVMVVLVSGCPQPQPVTPPLSCPASPLTEGPPPLLRPALLGVATKQVLPIPCAPAGGEVLGFTVSLEDPSGVRQPFSSTALELVDGALATTVEFTPTSTGAWTLLASMEPGLGEVIVPVMVWRDRSAQTPVLTFTVPEPCGELELAGGLVGCSGDRLHLILDGGVLAEDARSRLKAAGDVLWSWNSAGVSRWQGAERAQLAAPLAPRAFALSATQSRLELFEFGEIWEVVVDGGALERRPVLLDGGIETDTHHMLAVDGGWVWVRAPRGGETSDQTCFRGLGTPAQCAATSPFERVVGSEGDGFWVNGLRPAYLRFGAGPEPIEASYLSVPLPVYSSPPRLGYWQPVTVRAQTLELELWGDFPSVRVTPTHFFGITGQQVSAFER